MVSQNENQIIFYLSRGTKKASCSASGINWLMRPLMLQIDHWLPRAEVHGEHMEKHTCSADEKVWNGWISHFVICFVSIFGAFTLHFPAICCQSSRVGGFLTAISLGFILLIKFLLSFLFHPSPLLFQTHQKCRQTCRHQFLCKRRTEHQMFGEKLKCSQ